jgi:hypothetical protein
MRPGDALRQFSSPPNTWKSGKGMAGIAIVRDGKVIEAMFTERGWR